MSNSKAALSRSSASNQHGIAVVLVTYNRPQLLLEALYALKHQTSAAALIIVVDNASDLETQSLLSSTSGIDVVRSQVNLGGAGGFALGLQRALELGAQWMWLMDDDAIPDTTALETLEMRIDSVPGRIGALCSTVMEFGAVATMHRRYFDRNLGLERAVNCSAYRFGCDPCRVDTASFVGFMVSAVAVRSVGLPDAAFFLSYDDTEYSLRLGRSGFDLWLIPQSVIVHKRSRLNRLRSTEFGAKHYFNIRNRIVVKRLYCRVGYVGALNGALFGLALWLRSPRRFSVRAWTTLVRAITDGLSGRLGPFPDALKSADPYA